MRDLLSKRPVALNQEHLVHFVCWASLIFLEVIVVGALKQRFSSLGYYVLFYSLNVGLFYLHSLFVMPFSRNKNLVKILQFISLLVFEIFLYLIGAMVATIILREVFHEYSTSPNSFDFNYFVVVLYRALFFIAYATGYYFLKQYLNRREKEMARFLEVEKLQNQLLTAQKDYLRAQINPHLLFNTLDFIKAVSKKNPDQSDEAIDCLSEIMDYALETSRKDYVAVEREVEQIDHMIRLNVLRSNNRLNLEFKKEFNVRSAQIIPIVLLTLVENIFKHGNLLDKSHPALIELITNREGLIFRTRNLIGNTPPSRSEHTGLKNIKERLMQSYPESHIFKSSAKGNLFFTELQISF